mmetsp:Transcript_15739/g.32095  ORF Transcript_15739/g.32095 Transcript_15739/m.32095 type:complete len:227 (+) Transcript_15739:3455-4135(+)
MLSSKSWPSAAETFRLTTSWPCSTPRLSSLLTLTRELRCSVPIKASDRLGPTLTSLNASSSSAGCRRTQKPLSTPHPSPSRSTTTASRAWCSPSAASPRSTCPRSCPGQRVTRTPLFRGKRRTFAPCPPAFRSRRSSKMARSPTGRTIVPEPTRPRCKKTPRRSPHFSPKISSPPFRRNSSSRTRVLASSERSSTSSPLLLRRWWRRGGSRYSNRLLPGTWPRPTK